MSSSSSHPLDAGMRHHAYSRKQKSLGLLCANLYNRDGIDSIGLDDAARRLGVERRRIYDIVNIMESVGEEARRGITHSECAGFKVCFELSFQFHFLVSAVRKQCSC
ncbi:hypothetical protein B296_00034132 [Ensete ventricosum]|uniref:E2F/DP family winged-helix DNA-binding domain-containing protein n=1 Tax=Ensete ventricosum TaxID=4639 RepID=A0A427A9A2_ENSVE|nr:hypothetical protein B296_00034132 [Ensete ventricosum]